MEVEMEIEERDRAYRMIDLESECELLFQEKVNLERRVMELEDKEQRMKEKCMKRKGKYAELREKFDLEKMKWREENKKISGKYSEVVVEKRFLEIDIKAALSQQRGGDEGGTVAEVERLKSSLEEREGLVTTLLGKIQALERDKEEMVAEVSKLRKEKIEESEKSYSANKALEAEKKRSEKMEANNFELVKSVGALERAIKGIQDGICKLNREKSEGILDTPAAQNQEQSTPASAHERIQPLSEILTGGGSSNNSGALDRSAT